MVALQASISRRHQGAAGRQRQSDETLPERHSDPPLDLLRGLTGRPQPASLGQDLEQGVHLVLTDHL